MIKKGLMKVGLMGLRYQENFVYFILGGYVVLYDVFFDDWLVFEYVCLVE